MAVIPDMVAAELRAGRDTDSRIAGAVDAGWLEIRTLHTDREVTEFVRFSSLLVKGDRNVGEAGVLALAKVLSATAVVDDGAARRAARANGVTVRPTLALLCAAINQGLLTVKLVSALADDLLATEYRLPLGPGGFEAWAVANGMIADG